MTATNMPEAGSAHVTPGQVELILSQIESLPTLPPVAARLLEMTSGDRFGTGEIAGLVESDQSLSARVLSLVRKSNVGSGVQTVDRAVVLLGSDVIRSVVLGVQIFDAFRGETEEASSRFDRTGFWRHCLAVACAARLMVEKRVPVQGGRPRDRGVRPEEAFVCGLLHDLGKVLFDFCFPKSYDRVIEKVEARRADIADVEREVLGVDHAVAGHRLAQQWRLPQPIAECMWLHHHSPESTPARIGHPEYVLLVQAADRLVRQMHIGYSGNHGPDELGPAFHQAIGLTDAIVEQVMLELPEAIESRAEILGLHEISSREVLAETLVRTNGELARVNTELTLANRALEQRSRTLEAICTLSRTLGDDPRHESVAQAVAQGVGMLVPESAAAVAVSSPSRQLTVLAACPAGEARPRIEVVSTATDEATGKPDANAAPEAWLPGPVMDRLTVMMGEAPQYGRPIECSGGLTAAVLLAERPGDDTGRALGLIGEWAAPWFKAAEAAVFGQQLAGDLAEINRKLVKSQAELARVRSLAMVGEMAAGAAHELNNPLAVISGRAQILARSGLDEQATKSADTICEHAHRASAIVNELMDFAKPAPAKPTTWPLAALLADVRRTWLERGALTAGQFAVELSDDLPEIRADMSQIRLLFDEVIRNAVEAMHAREDKRLTVNCRSDVTDDRLVIRIEDNGCGMTPDVAERAMDPFFSYRPAGRGRGLGLSRAARYAQINGGTIRLSSRVKEGTAVIVELPAAAAE